MPDEFVCAVGTALSKKNDNDAVVRLVRLDTAHIHILLSDRHTGVRRRAGGHQAQQRLLAFATSREDRTDRAHF
ncbi:hypothetical protein [Umezawaea tangerina]|uniref:hypothetical protein n=1 Tax=Umezawaea tangerina TaxID=84725 RepID=UPI0011B2483D|nr:hypothetical protein [Umezawaea tangerina]